MDKKRQKDFFPITDKEYSKFYKTGELSMKEKVLSIKYDKHSPRRRITEIKTSYSHFFKSGNVKAKGENTYSHNLYSKLI